MFFTSQCTGKEVARNGGLLGTFSFPRKLYLCLLSCGRIALMWSRGRLAYPNLSMGEMTNLSPEKKDHSSHPKRSPGLMAEETVLASLVFRD